jgi:hypothetical protein
MRQLAIYLRNQKNSHFLERGRVSSPSYRKGIVAAKSVSIPLLLNRLILNPPDDIAVEDVHGAALSTIKPVNVVRRSALYR